MTPLRPARPADRPQLGGLQSHLPEPSPALLDHGLRTGGVLVATAAAGPGRSAGGNADGPVGYLLAVGVRFGGAGHPRETGGVSGRVEPVEASDARQPGVGSSDSTGTDGAEPDRPSAHLAELVVAPDRRRRGHGGALVDALLVRAGRVTVVVASDNEPALALYRSREFERVDRRPDAFAGGPGLVLARARRAGRPSGP